MGSEQASYLSALVGYVRGTFVAVCGGADEATRVLDVALLVVLAVGVLFLLRLALRQCADVGAAFWSFASTAGASVLKIVALALALYVLSSQALASFARISGSTTTTTPLQATSELARHAREHGAAAMKAAASSSASDWLVPSFVRAYLQAPPPPPPP